MSALPAEGAHAANCAGDNAPFCCAASAAGAHAIEMVDIFCAAQGAAARRLDERGNEATAPDVRELVNHIAHNVLEMYIAAHTDAASGVAVHKSPIARFPRLTRRGGVDLIEV